MDKPLIAALVLLAVAPPAQGAPKPDAPDVYKLRALYSVPGMDKVVARRNLAYREVGVARLEFDVYTPPGLARDERRPAVLFVHGGPLPSGARPKEWGIYLSYGELAAASGLVGITFNFRFAGTESAHVAEAASDVEALIRCIRKDAPALHVDPERIALWAFSGGGLMLSAPLRERPPYIRALVAYYAALDLAAPAAGQPDPQGLRPFSPLAQLALEGPTIPPLLVTSLGKDHLKQHADRFVAEALARNATLEVLTHPTGQHGFDALDDDPRTREIIARTLEFVKARLAP